MDNIIFEQDYREPLKTETDLKTNAIFEQAMTGGFFKAYSDAMDRIPKVIVQKDKENYEYLLARLDEFAKRHRGRIRGVVDYQKWESDIEVFLPFVGFESVEELELMREIAEKSNNVVIEPHKEGVRLHIMINYFAEEISEEEHSLLELGAIFQDKTLVSMLDIPELSGDDLEWAKRLGKILDRFEAETEFDRTTVFRALLRRMMEEPDENQSIPFMIALAEVLLNRVLNEGNE